MPNWIRVTATTREKEKSVSDQRSAGDEAKRTPLQVESTTVVIRMLPEQDADPTSVLTMRVEDYVSLEDVSTFTWPDGREYPLYYDIQQGGTLRSWGASSSVLKYLMDVSAEVSLDVMVGMLSSYISNRFPTGGPKVLPPDPSAAKNGAIQTVLNSDTSLSRTDLVTLDVGYDRDNGTETVELQSPKGTYKVTLRRFSGGHSIVALSGPPSST